VEFISCWSVSGTKFKHLSNYSVPQSRLYALNQIREILSGHKEGKGAPVDPGAAPQTLSTLLCSAHLCLLAGCFNLGLTNGPHGTTTNRLAYYCVGSLLC